MKRLLLFLLLASTASGQTDATQYTNGIVDYDVGFIVTHPVFDSEYLTADERRDFIDRLTRAESVRGIWNMGMSRMVVFDAEMLIAERKLDKLNAALDAAWQTKTTACTREHCDEGCASIVTNTLPFYVPMPNTVTNFYNLPFIVPTNWYVSPTITLTNMVYP